MLTITPCCIAIIYAETESTIMTTSMNERTHFIKIYLSYLILEWVDVGCVWEVSWRGGQTATYWPKVLLILAALSHPGRACSTVGHWGPQAHCLQADSHAGILSSNWLQLQLELTQAVCGTWLYNCLPFTCFRCSSAYLHRCISWLTARSRVNI